jgi:hypothetical protein
MEAGRDRHPLPDEHEQMDAGMGSSSRPILYPAQPMYLD